MFIDTSPKLDENWKTRTKEALSGSIVPFLKARFGPNSVNSAPLSPQATNLLCDVWRDVTNALIKALPLDQLFPLIDLWRMGLLDPSIATWCASDSLATSSPTKPLNPTFLILKHALLSQPPLPKPFILTTLRMLSNAFSNERLAHTLLDPTTRETLGRTWSGRQDLTSLVVPALLHDDLGVRTAAASLTFNIAVFVQKPRFEAQRRGRRGDEGSGDNDSEGDWEVEMISAILEALRIETSSEDVGKFRCVPLFPLCLLNAHVFCLVHRLTASLAFFIHLSPYYDTQLKPLLEVLQAQDVLKAKLSGGADGCGEKGVVKKDVRKLIDEVAKTFCD